MTSSSYIKIVCAEEADPESNRIMLRTTPPTFIELQPGENILTVETYPDLKYGFYPEQRRSDSISINDSCQSIIEVDLSHFDASEVQSTSSMFEDMSALTKVDLSNVRFSSVKDMSNMFSRCTSLEKVVVNSMNAFASKFLISANGMFYGASKIKSLGLAGFGGSNLRSIIGMFSRMESLVELDLSGWSLRGVNTGSVEESLFEGSPLIRKIYMLGCNDSTTKKIREEINNPYTHFATKAKIVRAIIKGAN